MPASGSWKAVLFPCQVDILLLNVDVAPWNVPAFSCGSACFSLTSAGTVGMHAGEGQRTGKCAPASFPPSLHPLHPHSHHSPTPDSAGFGPFVCALSREEVPSHLTLRKWFQCTLVWILTGFFCNCQFPYQSVCISMVGREREREKNLSYQPPPPPSTLLFRALLSW